jgi:hypothetical protein
MLANVRLAEMDLFGKSAEFDLLVGYMCNCLVSVMIIFSKLVFMFKKIQF